MQTDKRIFKTKKNLKETLITLLEKNSFESITVKSICEKSNTSRITFYNHYGDKYDLLDDISKDMLGVAQNEYMKLQATNNTQRDPLLSYCNFLESILNMYYKNFNFFSHATAHENPYLNFCFYKYILEYLEIHTQKRSSLMKPKYSIKKIAGFLCYGLWGFISESLKEKCSIDQIKAEVLKILKDTLRSEILTENNLYK